MTCFFHDHTRLRVLTAPTALALTDTDPVLVCQQACSFPTPIAVRTISTRTPAPAITWQYVRVFRVIVPVEDIDAAAMFYRALLGADGERVTSGRHYFDCDGVVLACWDPIADGDPAFPAPNPGHLYLSTSEPLETLRQRVIDAGAVLDHTRCGIARQSWGERSFYARDPWDNPFGVVESGPEYRGGDFEPPAASG